MSTAIAQRSATQSSGVPALAMDEKELIDVLRNSLYPGAADQSIKLVIGYCRASGLDPMQKPVHIVPMWDRNTSAMRDVVMPGIGLYRVQAARSGDYAGVSEPEFGPDVTAKVGGVEITYPSWCKVIVKRLMSNGSVAEFAATERWLENYAVKGGKEKSVAPNAMWMRRPYAQLAKCAEAQALRKAFPEISAQPTAEEMEGREFEPITVITEPARSIPGPYPEAKMTDNLPAYTNLVKSGAKTPDDIIKTIKSKYTMTAEQEKRITDLAAKPAAGKPAPDEWGDAYDKKAAAKTQNERQPGEEG